MKTIVNYANKVKEQHALNKSLAPVETDLTDASRAYAIGQKFIYDGNLFRAKTAIAQHDALVLNTNYEAADDVSTEIEALTNNLADEVATRAELGAHNLLNAHDFVPRTINDLPFVLNSDGSVKIQGTASNDCYPYLNNSANNSLILKKGSYILSGTSNNVALVIKKRVNGSDVSIGYINQANQELEFTLDADYSISCYLQVAAGTYDVTIYPMIRLASDTDNTYQPYAKTNQELTKDNSGLTANAFANGAVNLGNNTATSQTITTGGANLAFVVNSNKEVTVNGTTGTTLITLKVIDNFTGLSKVKLSGCPSGGDATTYGLQLYDVTSGTYGNTDYGDGVVATLDPTHTYNAIIYVRANQTISSKVFKPMITFADMPNSDYNHYVPYAKTNQELTAESQTLTQNDDAILNVLGAKNVLENKAVSDSKNGITFTVNADKSITVSGTASANATIGVNTEYKPKAGKYILSSGIVNDKCYLSMEAYNGNTWVKVIGNTSAGEFAFDVDYNGYDTIRVYLTVTNGASFTTPITIYPMVRPASVKDNTYAEPAKTNRELTEDLSNGLIYLGRHKQSVKADGTKTYQQLLYDCKSALTTYMASLGSNYRCIGVMASAGSYSVNIMPSTHDVLDAHRAGTLRGVDIRITSASIPLKITTIQMNDENAAWNYIESTEISNAPACTYTNHSAEVPAANTDVYIVVDVYRMV